MKKICLIRSNGILGDSRVRKYLDFYKNKSLTHSILGWDRDGDNNQMPCTLFYRKKSGYNMGGFRAVKYRLLWFKFVLLSLIKIRPDFIHACDLDCAFPAALYKMIRPKTVLVFDVFDWLSATLYNQNWLIRKAFVILEKFSTSMSDHVIICEPERRSQIPYNIDVKCSILPNIPNIDLTSLHNNVEYFSNKKITIGYVGAFYNERFLKELFSIAKKGTINLLLAGYGDKSLEDEAHELNECDNVKYYGKVDYIMGMSILKASDVIYAMYCKSNPNNVCAAPNKFYESLALGKPIITTHGTSIGDKVEKEAIGFSIEESIDELSNAIQTAIGNKELLAEMGARAQKLWSKRYNNYVDAYLNSTYWDLLMK